MCIGNYLGQTLRVSKSGAVNSSELASYAAWGTVLAPLSHVWFNALAKFGPKNIFATTAVDHVLWKWPVLFCFLIYTQLWKVLFHV